MWFDSTSSHFEVNEKSSFILLDLLWRLLRGRDYLSLDLCSFAGVEMAR